MFSVHYIISLFAMVRVGLGWTKQTESRNMTELGNEEGGRLDIHLHLLGKDIPIESGAQNGGKWTGQSSQIGQRDRKGSMRQEIHTIR